MMRRGMPSAPGAAAPRETERAIKVRRARSLVHIALARVAGSLQHGFPYPSAARAFLNIRIHGLS
jgi:hypothetical protein